MNETIGFVGTGRMGANMARRLKEAGFSVTAVYDSSPGAAAAVAEEIGAVHASSLAAVTGSADVIVTVVSDDQAQLGIFKAPEDNLLKSARGKLFINCATVSPAIHREIERLAIEAGASALETCMASSITQAREGSLYLMCGGARATFDRALPVLTALGPAPRYIGPAGSAAQVKALVNMVMNINTAGLAEGLGLGAALGLDPEMLLEVFSQTGAASRVLVTDGTDMIRRDHDCFFSAAHAAKDSGIALALAREAGLQTPLAAAAKAQFDRMVSGGLGHLDKSGIAELTFPGRSA